MHFYALHQSPVTLCALQQGEQPLNRQNKNPGVAEAQLDLQLVLLPNNLQRLITTVQRQLSFCDPDHLD